MSKFYKKLELFYFVVACFFVIVLVPTIVYNIVYKKWGLVLIILIAMVLMITIAIFILLYYRNIVIEVLFEQDNTIIKTNKIVYTYRAKILLKYMIENYGKNVFII
jgi:hypothetical protein